MSGRRSPRSAHASVVPWPASVSKTAMFILAHVPLAVAMDNFAPLAAMHAYGTLLVGLKAAFSRQMARAALVGAYVIGADVLWRMTASSLPWEFGKYAVIAIFGLALIRTWRFTAPVAPSLYFAGLLPSTALTFAMFRLSEARGAVSFNLSGPLTLAISAAFFSHSRLSNEKVRSLFFTVMAPIVGIAAIALYGILTTPNIVFNTESNAATSGGFGPNQVSSVLGLGAMLAFWCLTDKQITAPMRGLMAGCFLFLAAQSVMTFSRGGIYGTVGGILAGSVFLATDRVALKRLVVSAALILTVGQFVLLPRLDRFTGGTLVKRFEDTELTHRGELGLAELDLWRRNPLLGVGPGVSPVVRAYRVATHTEFTRVLAEHGSFGAASLLALIVGGMLSVWKAPDPRSRSVITSMLVWSFMYMSNAAMRIAAPSFAIGFAYGVFLPVGQLVPQPAPTSARGVPWRGLRPREATIGPGA